ncbi:MAG: hypothetical protein U0X20_11750 [Caldilineaceae bacterium]
MIRFLHPYPFDKRAIALVIAILRLQFSIVLDWSNDNRLKLTLYSNRSRLQAWESYLNINTGPAITENYWGFTRTVRRFGIYSSHTDHYVLLAERLAKHFPWLAEMEYPLPEGEIEGQGFTLMENPKGRIKPLGWAHRTL